MVFEEVNNTTINEEKIIESLSDNELFTYIFERYVSRLELLFQHLPEPGSATSLNIHSIPLHEYYHRKGELEPLIFELKSLC